MNFKGFKRQYWRRKVKSFLWMNSGVGLMLITSARYALETSIIQNINCEILVWNKERLNSAVLSTNEDFGYIGEESL